VSESFEALRPAERELVCELIEQLVVVLERHAPGLLLQIVDLEVRPPSAEMVSAE
jgi:hypothetical protein